MSVGLRPSPAEPPALSGPGAAAPGCALREEGRGGAAAGAPPVPRRLGPRGRVLPWDSGLILREPGGGVAVGVWGRFGEFANG